MKPSELFRAAAREIERNPRDPRNYYACWVLWRELGMGASDVSLWGFLDGFRQKLLPERIKAYLALLRPTRPHAHGSWWPTGGQPYQDERVLMLCFAAAIAEEAGE